MLASSCYELVREGAFLLGYSFKINFLKGVPNCLSRDSSRDDGINVFCGLNSSRSLSDMI